MQYLKFIVLFVVLTNTIWANGIHDKYKLGDPKDTTGLAKISWPDCPSINEVVSVKLDDNTYLLKWDLLSSNRIEYSVVINNNGNILKKGRSNSGIYIFQVDDSWDVSNISIDIHTLCYLQNSNKPIESVAYSKGLFKFQKESVDLCDANSLLVEFESLPSFTTINTRMPSDANITFNICNSKDDCNYFNHSISSSGVYDSEQSSLKDLKVYTKFGNYSCSTKMKSISDICSSIVVTELSDCYYQIDYPDGVEPYDCGLIIQPSTTNSLCGYPTGSIKLDVTGGEEPYSFSWSDGHTGAEYSDLVSGDYTVTVFDDVGCMLATTITISEVNSISFSDIGGIDGLDVDLKFQPGVILDWDFRPWGISDQFKLLDNGVEILNTGIVTTSSRQSCSPGNSCCSDVFLGDYSNFDKLPILVGNANKKGSAVTGEFTVPPSGSVSAKVIGDICSLSGGTAWSLSLACHDPGRSLVSQPELEDLGYTQVEDEVALLISSGDITYEQFVSDCYNPLINRT